MIEYAQIMLTEKKEGDCITIKAADKHRIILVGFASPQFLIRAIMVLVETLNKNFTKEGKEICVTIRSRD